jgi:hypothetical protein
VQPVGAIEVSILPVSLLDGLYCQALDGGKVLG